MSESNLPPTNYQSNKGQPNEEEGTNKRDLKPLVSGQERSKGLFTKFKESFAGDDAQTVGQYVLFDVVIPATKNLIFDMVREGFSRMLFGTGAPARSSGSSVGSRTSYNTIYSGRGNGPRELSQSSRATHDFKEIVFETRDEANAVLRGLDDLINEYGTASVADFYTLANVTANFADNKYGWRNLSSVPQPRYTREGYVIDFPRTVVLE